LVNTGKIRQETIITLVTLEKLIVDWLTFTGFMTELEIKPRYAWNFKFSINAKGMQKL
jgi:hypothetical protein